MLTCGFQTFLYLYDMTKLDFLCKMDQWVWAFNKKNVGDSIYLQVSTSQILSTVSQKQIYVNDYKFSLPQNFRISIMRLCSLEFGLCERYSDEEFKVGWFGWCIFLDLCLMFMWFCCCLIGCPSFATKTLRFSILPIGDAFLVGKLNGTFWENHSRLY